MVFPASAVLAPESAHALLVQKAFSDTGIKDAVCNTTQAIVIP